MDNIGDRIRLRRHQLGMSVRELAQRVGVSHGTVSKWERGQTNGVSDPNLKKLAKVLDCNILWLIGLDSAITVTDDFETDLEEIPPVRRVPILGEIACGDPILSRDVIRQGLQLALLKEHTSDAAVIRIFVHQVVLYDDSFLIEFNFKGAEGLERSDLLGFDLSGKWWSIDCLGRTLIIYRGRVLLFSSK